MAYSKYRQHQNIALAAGRTNNSVLFNLWIPGTVVIRIFRFFAYMSTAGSASTQLDLKQDAAAASSVVVTGSTTGLKEATVITTSAPLVITAAAAGSVLQIVQNTLDSTGIGTCWLDYETVFI